MFSPVIPPFFAISSLRLQGRENVLRREKTKEKNTTENAEVMLLRLGERCHCQKRESIVGGNFPITKLKGPCKFIYF